MTEAGMPGAERGIRVELTGEFQLVIDERAVEMPRSVQRVVAFLAMARGPVPRTRVAGRLWHDATEQRARGNLRSVLWRLRRIPRRVVQTVDERLALHADVAVDVTELTALSERMLATPALGDRDASGVMKLAAANDILPGWEEEWLLIERERFRELRLHALEHACESLLGRGDYAGAIQAGLAAVECEPYRESARRLLVRVHLREGNRAAALSSYLTYRKLIVSDLGIQPSDQMLALVAELASPKLGVTLR